MKKVYYVTMTYLNTIEAESYEEAEELTEEMIRDGDLVPNYIETEIAKDIEIQEDNIQYKYQYNGTKYKDKEEVIDVLILDEEIDTFENWINDSYTACEIYENPYTELEPKYEEYKENIFIWCLQVGRVKELK